MPGAPPLLWVARGGACDARGSAAELVSAAVTAALGAAATEPVAEDPKLE